MNRQRLTIAATAFVLAAVPTIALLSSNSALAQDAITDTFQKKCLTCHGPTAAKGAVAGPSLNGMAGKSIASVKGYAYSDGLKAKSKEKWTDANLDAYLTKPREFAPGGKMLPSVGDPAQRKAIIAHMKTLK